MHAETLYVKSTYLGKLDGTFVEGPEEIARDLYRGMTIVLHGVRVHAHPEIVVVYRLVHVAGRSLVEIVLCCRANSLFPVEIISSCWRPVRAQ